MNLRKYVPNPLLTSGCCRIVHFLRNKVNNWLDNEFAEQNMGDARLNRRVKQLVESLSQDVVAQT